jgi:hypothetical protein
MALSSPVQGGLWRVERQVSSPLGPQPLNLVLFVVTSDADNRRSPRGNPHPMQRPDHGIQQTPSSIRHENLFAPPRKILNLYFLTTDSRRNGQGVDHTPMAQ